VSEALNRLRALLLVEGGLIAGLLDHEPQNDSVGATRMSRGSALADGAVAQLAAAGPRAAGRREQYELLIDTVYEGYLLHYHLPRVMHAPEEDLGLLAGDRLYALGLAALVKLGDLEAVTELADVITLTALAHASAQPELADAVWMAGAHAVGWGSSSDHDRAKALTRAASPGALEAMRGLAAT
jgi:hypothetical protein